MTHARITLFVGLFVATLAIFLGFHNQALAYFFDGNQLYRDCKSERTVDQMNCLSFTTAAADAVEIGLNINGQVMGACFPEHVTRGQIKDVIVSWLEKNPKDRHVRAILISLVALRQAFPCGN
jgi:hypothetical protein